MTWKSVLSIVGLYKAGSLVPVDEANRLPVRDDGTGLISRHLTLVAGQNTPIDFGQPVRSIRVQNWDTANRILVKSSAIATNADPEASRVGKAPATDVPNGEVYGFVTSVIYLRSAAASEVTVEGFT